MLEPPRRVFTPQRALFHTVFLPNAGILADATAYEASGGWTSEPRVCVGTERGRSRPAPRCAQVVGHQRSRPVWADREPAGPLACVGAVSLTCERPRYRVTGHRRQPALPRLRDGGLSTGEQVGEPCR